MNGLATKDVAVVIPARNEAERIGDCLGALQGQSPGRLAVVVVVNNTDDGTATIAREASARLGIAAEVLEVELPDGHGVGTARRIGVDHALALIPGLRYLLNTDADCLAAPDWVARNIALLDGADVVCGRVAPIESEQHLLAAMDLRLAEFEGRYRALVMNFWERHAPDPDNPLPHHGEPAGASLALRAEAYRKVGGFADLRCGEDRDLLRRCRAAGLRVRFADDTFVRASLRLSGRAPGGMSEALRNRVSGAAYVIDECLPPARWLAEHRDRLPPWPPEQVGYNALRVTDLPAEIAALEALLATSLAPAALAGGARPERAAHTPAPTMQPVPFPGTAAIPTLNQDPVRPGTKGVTA